MILVDSSVWIDDFNGTINEPTDKLDELLSHEPLVIGDLILAEVLQGLVDERTFNKARGMLTSLTVVHLGGREIAIQAARNFRMLRRAGVTIGKTIDTIIATFDQRWNQLLNYLREPGQGAIALTSQYVVQLGKQVGETVPEL